MGLSLAAPMCLPRPGQLSDTRFGFAGCDLTLAPSVTELGSWEFGRSGLGIGGVYGQRQRYTLGALGTTASHSLPRHARDWTLQHRHPDGRHWQIIGHYPTKELARETAKAFVASYYGEPEDFRVRRSPPLADEA